MVANQKLSPKTGFSLVELTIIIVILGILAGVAVPLFIDMSNEAKESAARRTLGTIRSAINIQYTKSAVTTITGATYPSSLTGALFSDGLVPINPINNLRTVQAWDGSAAADDSTGWQYNASTGQVRLNLTGNDSSGDAWTSY